MTCDTGEGHVSDTICIVFDTVDQTVYEMEAWDYCNEREYRWIHPDYFKAHKKEAKKRGLKHRNSFDDRNFIDLDVEEDILEKARAIFLGEEYDTRVTIQLEIGEENEIMLMRLAHENDMTVNQYVEKILKEEIERLS
jgi:hypothetical protein